MKIIGILRSTFLLLFLTLLLSAHTAYAQGFAWAHEIVSPASNGNPGITACATDGNNNGYFVGIFSGTTDFDPGPGVQSLTAVSDFDMYILKNDAAGNFQWVKHIAAITVSNYVCSGKAIELDNSGNIYIGGVFGSSFDFDPGPGVHALSAYGGGHAFVLKLNPTGDFIWVKDIGSQTSVAFIGIQSMKMDADANIFFTGGFSSNPSVTIDVDPGPGVYNILCPTQADFLIEKLDSAGNFIWAKQISGPDAQAAYHLALDTASNIYVTGRFMANADFDPGPGVANLTSTALYDIFIAKYDSAGNYQWAKQIGSNGEDFAYGIATDTFGGVVVTGAIAAGTTDFDPGPGVFNITNTSRDMFVLKLRDDGSFWWANSVHPSGNDGGTAITTDGLGNVYTTGDMFTSADFDPGPGEYWLSGVAYVQKLDSAGNFGWAKVFGGQYPQAIALDQANDIYVVGWFTTPGDFDPGPGVFTLSGDHAGFIEKLCGTSLAITAADSTLCAGDNTQLSTPAITGATYTWTRNDTVIAGNSNSITISQPGVYEVYVDGGCPSASGPLYIMDCTGVGEAMKAAGIAVYPNPFEDVLTVKGLQVNDQVSLIDITGRVLHSWQCAMSTETFMINDVAPGYYVLKVMNEHGVVRVNVPVVKR